MLDLMLVYLSPKQLCNVWFIEQSRWYNMLTTTLGSWPASLSMIMIRCPHRRMCILFFFCCCCCSLSLSHRRYANESVFMLLMCSGRPCNKACCPKGCVSMSGRKVGGAAEVFKKEKRLLPAGLYPRAKFSSEGSVWVSGDTMKSAAL